MIWGQAGAVPAIGFWTSCALGALLGVVGMRALRHKRRGVLLVALALLIPVSARAVTLITFNNGTVADANQVNANFAALQPISGAVTASSLGPFPPGDRQVYLPSFVAPRAMTCVVTVTGLIHVNDPNLTPTFGTMAGAMLLNGGQGSTDPINSLLFTGYAKTADPTTWQGDQTNRFSVTAGSTVAFGCNFGIGGTGLDTNAFSLVVKGVYLCY
jgi:hypothetical protein